MVSATGADAAATPVIHRRSTPEIAFKSAPSSRGRVPGAGDRLHPTRRREPPAAARPAAQTLPLASRTGGHRRRRQKTIVPRLDDSSTCASAIASAFGPKLQTPAFDDQGQRPPHGPILAMRKHAGQSRSCRLTVSPAALPVAEQSSRAGAVTGVDASSSHGAAEHGRLGPQPCSDFSTSMSPAAAPVWECAEMSRKSQTGSVSTLKVTPPHRQRPVMGLGTSATHRRPTHLWFRRQRAPAGGARARIQKQPAGRAFVARLVALLGRCCLTATTSSRRTRSSYRVWA